MLVRRSALWWPGLFLALALVMACPSAPAAPERSFDAAADELAVLTFNVYGFPLFESWQRPARFSQLKDELASSLADVDVVLLQEAFIPYTRVLREARRHAVAGACGDDDRFNPTGLLVVTDHEPVGEARRFAFVKGAQGQWRLTEEEDLDCAALAARRKPHKGMMAMTVSTPRGLVDLINVHLDVKREAREEQKRLLATFLRERESARPVILAGDLNEDPCDDRDGFPGEVTMTDASCGVGPTTGGLRFGILQGAFGSAEIDHVYVSGAEPTDKRQRLFSRPRAGGHLSDHDGVLALVRLRTGKAGLAATRR